MPSLFDNLPFTQAIDALMNRLAIRKDKFLELDAAARSRAFTMAWVNDLHFLESIHDELSLAIAEGKTFAQFERAIRENQLRGWTGTAPWHHRLVYETNLNMAYAAGRVQQAVESGMRAWRYLPSNSDVPRPEHEEYYNRIYRFAPGSPVPPIDFNCNCGWELVFPEELEALGIDPAELPVFDPPVPRSGFVWSPADYVGASRRIGDQFSVISAQLSAPCLRGECISARQSPPEAPQTWIEAATKAAGTLFEDKLEALLGRLGELEREGLSLQAMANRLTEAMAVIRSNEDVELNRLVVLAALLRGRAQTENELDRQGAKDAKDIQ